MTGISSYSLVPLASTHKVGAFACGNVEIDSFIQNDALVEQNAGLSRVYVAADPGNRVLGFFTLSPITIKVDSVLLRTLQIQIEVPYPSIGGFLLGRMGVDASNAGKGLGGALVIRACQIARAESESVGGAFVAVDPKNEKLVQWYERFGFTRLSSGSRRMVVPFGAVP